METSPATTTISPPFAQCPRIIRAVRCFTLCLLGVVTNAEQTPSSTPEDLLRQIIATYRVGDLETAWENYMAFFRHPGRNELDYREFVDCFFLEQCPDIGVLGQIIGKSRAEPVNLESFCPRLRRDPEDTDRMTKAEPRKMYDRVVANGLRDTCPAWAARQRSQLNEAPVPTTAVPEALPLTWYEPQSGGFIPAIDVLAGSTPLRPIVDTGSSGSVLIMPLDEAARRSDLELSDMRQRATGIHAVFSLTIAKLDALRLGSTLYRQVRFDVEDTDEENLDHPFPHASLIGMNVLLRYEAVCFAWYEQRLYLGTLGPCASGEAPYAAWLTGSLTIDIAIPTDDGTQFPAMFDTGERHTNCSKDFLAANGDELSFSFGDHPALTGECVIDESVLFPGLEWGYDQVAIRMNTLLQFQAFGWQLNPLRLFFVPRKADIATADAGHGDG